MSDPRPIGIFDSGVGGLTVARAVAERLPGERIVYFADTAHVPYGPRPLHEIQHFAVSICDFLIRGEAKMVLMGCNMSSAVALDAAQARFDVPIMGMIDSAMDTVAELELPRRFGVIATEGTVRSGAYQAALASLNSGTQVFAQACPDFVPLVEAGDTQSDRAREAVARYLRPLQSQEIDTLILGCTHYPFLRHLLHEFLGSDVELIDPAEAMARRVAALLDNLNAAANHVQPGHVFYASGDGNTLMEWSRRDLGLTIDEVKPGPVF